MRIKSHKLGMLLAIAVLFVSTAFFSLGAMRSGRASAGDGTDGNGSFVTIHDEGEKTIVKSSNVTVREMLDSAKIAIDEKADIVEPGLDEAISGRDFHINIYRARPALVIDGTRAIKLMTASTVPRDVAAAAGVELLPEDVVKITTDNNFATTGIAFAYEVFRARTVRFNYYGISLEARTQARTVADFLRDRGIELSADDWLSLALDAQIVDGLELTLNRNGKSTVVVEEEIPHGEKVTQDYNRDLGYREVTVPGIPGKKVVTYEIEMQDGREISRVRISEIVTTAPVQAEVTVGARIKQTTSPTENENISWKFLRAQGFSRNQTAGIMGNLMQEHHFSTTDTRGGLGIVQWTASRRALLMSKFPSNWESIHAQLEFLMFELNGSYARVKAEILGSSTVEESVRIFQNKFERCGKCMEDKRIQYAYEILGRHEE